jgi:general secretion pathway protein D
MNATLLNHFPRLLCGFAGLALLCLAAPADAQVSPPIQAPSAAAAAAANNQANAANPAPAALEDGEPMTNVQFPNTPIPVILLEYERLTGKRVIRDTSIQDKNLIIQTSGKMTYLEAAEFIEKSFLLNGYAILPTEQPDQLKIIAYNSDKKPSSEGLPVYTSPFQLPESDQIVTYIMPLSYLSSEAAAEMFTNIVQVHPYGKITPLQNASAVVITENASVIRRLIELRDHLDVSPTQTVDKAFQLERADAEDVVEALIDVLGLDQESSGTGGSAAAPGQPPVPNQGNPNTLVNSPDSSGLPSQNQGGATFTKANAPKPRVRAIPRANRVLVVASPPDMDYIESIISHLDAPVETSSLLRRQLRYIAVGDFLKIANDVILRGLGSEDSQGAQISGAQENDQNGLGNNQTNGNTNGNQSGLGGTNGLGGTGGSGRGGAAGGLGNAGADQAAAPQSVVIDKTLLIADNIQNMLIASGPPENLKRIEELLEAMDVRPVQIQISAIIAQLSLGDEYEFALNFLRTLEKPAGNARGSRFNGGGTAISNAPPQLFNLEGLTDPAKFVPSPSGLSLYGQLNSYLDMHLSALESTNRLTVLSRPTIYTVNNRQAVIDSGQRVAVPRSTLSSFDAGGGINNNNNNQVVTANIDYENVVLRIAVVPLINADGEITLQIQQQNDSIIGNRIISGQAVPTIGTQSLGTTVMVDDGGTVLLGGLISEGDTKDESGIPLFANIPLLGRVFGSTKDNVNRQELLIFIQPKVIRQSSDQFLADRDMKDRTRIGEQADDWAVDADNNLDVFETQDFNSPEKRIFFFRDLFKKKPSATVSPVNGPATIPLPVATPVE